MEAVTSETRGERRRGERRREREGEGMLRRRRGGEGEERCSGEGDGEDCKELYRIVWDGWVCKEARARVE